MLVVLDGFNASALLTELGSQTAGARLQKFSQLTEDEFLLHLRSAGRTDRLLISLHPERARFHLLLDEHPPAIVPSSFVMLCRKQIGGCRLERLSQVGLDRRIELRFNSGFSLVFDWAGRPPSLLLLKSQERLVAGVYPGRGRFRLRSVYTPEVGDQPGVLSLTPSALWSRLQALPPETPLAEALEESAWDWAPLWKTRLADLAGARRVGELRRERLESAFTAIVEPLRAGGPFSPALEGSGLTYCAETPRFKTMQEAAVACWRESSRAPGVSDFRQDLLKLLKKNREKAVRKRDKRRQDLKGAASAPQDQLKGDLLLAYASSVKRGVERYDTHDWEGRPLTITLDPRLNATENAERYYNKAKKKRRALTFLEEQIALAEEEVEMWDELLYAAESAESRTDLEQVRKSMPSGSPGGKKPKAVPEVPSSGPRRYRHGGFLLLVGRNPAQNELLSFRTAAKDDHWFHVRQGAGSHVIIRTAGAEPPLETREAAAWLAAKFSRSSESPAVEVVTTRARYLKKPKGGPLGKALYRQEQEIVVNPTGGRPEGLTEETKNEPPS